MDRKARILRDWGVLGAYLLVIFVVLPFSEYAARRAIQQYPNFSSTVTTLLNLYIGVIGAALAIYTVVAEKNLKPLRLVTLALILVAGFYGVNSLKFAYDKLHVIEYSILSLLLFRVLRFYNTTTALYFWCVIFSVVAGSADEFVQKFIPGRTSSLLDIRTDLCAATLTGLAIAFVICPRLEKWRIRMDFLKKELCAQTEWVDDYKRNRSR